MTDRSVDEVINLMFDQLDEDGALFNALMHEALDGGVHPWESAPKMFMEIRVPVGFQKMLSQIEMPVDLSRADFEGALFTFFVIHGLKAIASRNGPSKLGGILGEILNSIVKDAAGHMDDEDMEDRDCSTCDKADVCPIADKGDGKVGNC